MQASMQVQVDQPDPNLLLQSPPNPPQTNYQQHIPYQEYATLHVGLCSAIQNTATNSILRTALFNVYAQNQYFNNNYVQLLERLCEYYHAVKIGGYQRDFDALIEDTIRTELPVIAENIPWVQQYLDQHAMAKLQEYIQLRHRVRNFIEQVFGQQQMNMPNNMQMNTGMGMNTGANMGMNMNQNVGSGPPMPPNAYGAQGRSGPPTPAMGNMNRTQPNPSIGGNVAQGNQSQMMVNNPHANMMGTTDSSSRPQTDFGHRNPTNGDSNTKQQSGEQQMNQDDRELAHELNKSELTKEQTEHLVFHPRIKPARRAHQRWVSTTHDGVVCYAIVEQGDELVNYEDHELNATALDIARRSKHGPRNQNQARWSDVSFPKEVSSETPASEDEDGEIRSTAPITLGTPVDAYSIEQAHCEALKELAKSGIDEYGDRVYEYVATLRTPVMVNKTEYEAIKELIDSSSTLTAFIDGFRKLSDKLHGQIWHLLDERLTRRIMDRVHAGATITDLEIDNSISDEYEDLIAELEKDLSSAVIDRFKENARKYLLKSIEPRRDSVNNENYLSECYSFTHLPWDSTEFNLVIDPKFSVLSQEVDENLYTAAQKLFDRTDKKMRSVNRRFLVTSDNVYLELHSSDIGTGVNIMIRRVAF